MNEKEIEKLEKKIKLAKECAEYLDKKHEESYEIDYSAFIPNGYDLKKQVKDYEYLKEVLTILTEKGIDVEKKYKIMGDIYLSIAAREDMSFYFSIENYSWIYGNYISSVSGINEWLYNIIADAYNLYSGNSDYSYVFNTVSLNQFRTCIENYKKDNRSDRPYAAVQVACTIENLIKFFTDENNVVRNAIVKELEFNLMKELIEPKNE